jgi:hypothetical protein
VTLTVTKPDRRTGVATVTDSSHDVDAGSKTTLFLCLSTRSTWTQPPAISLCPSSWQAFPPTIADMNDSYKTLCALAITQQGCRPNHRGNRLDYSLCWALHLVHSCFTLFVDSHNGGCIRAFSVCVLGSTVLLPPSSIVLLNPLDTDHAKRMWIVSKTTTFFCKHLFNEQ